MPGVVSLEKPVRFEPPVARFPTLKAATRGGLSFSHEFFRANLFKRKFSRLSNHMETMSEFLSRGKVLYGTIEAPCKHLANEIVDTEETE